MARSDKAVVSTEGTRERNRRETSQRITQAGLRLFSQHGFEATTVDAIAAAAGISRRSFFHYFKSKDDILLNMHKGMGEQLAEALASTTNLPPLQAVRTAALQVVSGYPLDELIVIDRLMRASAAVQASKQASYARDEVVLFEAMKKLWPKRSDASLRMLAMLSIGVARLSLDAWSRTDGTTTLSEHLEKAFDALETLTVSDA